MTRPPPNADALSVILCRPDVDAALFRVLSAIRSTSPSAQFGLHNGAYQTLRLLTRRRSDIDARSCRCGNRFLSSMPPGPPTCVLCGVAPSVTGGSTFSVAL